MTALPVAPRAAARADVATAHAWYRAEAGEAVAVAFLDAVEAAFRDLSRAPGAGSPTIGRDIGLDGLRAWPLRRFPYRVFYVERPESIDVWRVLHAARDIPERLREPTGP